VRVVHLEIAGRVQGVGFRWFVRERAAAFEISGWVRNLTSGNIEIAAAGAGESVDQFLEAVRAGPPGADIKQVISLKPPASLELPYPFTILK
jgi:acylphosphatase